MLYVAFVRSITPKRARCRGSERLSRVGICVRVRCAYKNSDVDPNVGATAVGATRGRRSYLISVYRRAEADTSASYKSRVSAYGFTVTAAELPFVLVSVTVTATMFPAVAF
jgi:hypothetical protein